MYYKCTSDTRAGVEMNRGFTEIFYLLPENYFLSKLNAQPDEHIQWARSSRKSRENKDVLGISTSLS